MKNTYKAQTTLWVLKWCNGNPLCCVSNRSRCMLVEKRFDLLHGITDGGDGHIVIDSGYKVGGVLGAVHIKVPRTLQQLRLPVSQIGTQNGSQRTGCNSCVKLLQTAGEQGEGGIANDVLGTALFQLAGNFQHTFAGGNDIISNENSFSFHAFTQYSWATMGFRPLTMRL